MTIEKKTPRKEASVISDKQVGVEPHIKPEALAIKSKKTMVQKTVPMDASVKVHPALLAPETQHPSARIRTRLSKAFSRPLDKQLKKIRLVRDRFTFPEMEYEQLVVLKKRLSDQEIMVKKSQLVRAGLMLLAHLDDEELKNLLAKVPPAG